MSIIAVYHIAQEVRQSQHTFRAFQFTCAGANDDFRGNSLLAHFGWPTMTLIEEV